MSSAKRRSAGLKVEVGTETAACTAGCMSSIAADAVIASADTEIAADCRLSSGCTRCGSERTRRRNRAQPRAPCCPQRTESLRRAPTGHVVKIDLQHELETGRPQLCRTAIDRLARMSIINCQFMPSLRARSAHVSGVEDLTEHPVKNFKLLKPTHADARESAVTLVSTAYPHVRAASRLERVSVSANVRVHKLVCDGSGSMPWRRNVALTISTLSTFSRENAIKSSSR